MTNVFPPGPKGKPIIGNLRDFQSTSRHLIFLDWFKEYGDLVHFKIFNRHSYIFSHPDMVSRVLVKEAKNFEKTPLLKRGTNRVIGEGLLTSEGDFHKRQRQLAQPAFHMQRIANYADTIVEYTQNKVASWHDNQQVDIHEELMTLTMEIIAKVLFDADVSEDSYKLGEAITIGIDAAMTRIRTPLTLPIWLPTQSNRKNNAAFNLLDTTIDSIIQARRGTMEDKGDLLSMLLLSEDETGGHMSDKQVRDEAMTLFLAGHETTANALTWTMYLLSQHPEVEQKLIAEVDSILQGRTATMADLKQLPYTEMVVKESMRLYPPAWVITRLSMEDFEIEGYTIPKGSIIITSPYVIHRHPDFWDDPEAFNPERFTPELESKRHKYAYFPFGGGPRVCIGNHFAMMEAELILATLMQGFTAKHVAGTAVIPEPLITLRPQNSIMMDLHQRHIEPIKELA